MRWQRISFVQRARWLMGTCLLLVLAWALRPTQAIACYTVLNPTDLSGCIDLAQYRIWEGFAGTLWSINAGILAAAYYAHLIQVKLVLNVFPNIYGVMVTFIEPLVGPFGQLVLMVALLLVIALPIIGKVGLIDIRTTMIWMVLGPLLLGLGSGLLQDIERTRIETIATFFHDIADQTTGQFVADGAAIRDIGPLHKNVDQWGDCGHPIEDADFPGSSKTVYRADELVASGLFWASFTDIFCPEILGPGRTVPDDFYTPAPNGPGFATRDVGNLGSGPRATAIYNIQRGVTRLTIGILPSLLALLEALISLLFTLAMIITWLTLPLSLLLVLFFGIQPLVTIARSAVGLITTSITCSVVMGICYGALLGAIQAGSVSVVIGAAIAEVFIASYVLMVAFSTLKDALGTVNSIAKSMTGVGLDAPATSMARGAAMVGMAAATGGAGLVTGLAVGNQAFGASGGSNRYSAAAMAGRFRPVMAVGETLAKAGVLDTDGEVYKGLRVGAETAKPSTSMDGIKKAVKRDIDRKGEDGKRLPERRAERAQEAAARIVHNERDQALLATEDGMIQSGKVRAIQQNAGGEIAAVGYETRRHDRAFAKRNELDMPALLDLGYAYRPHDDGQIEYWNPNDTSDDADEIKALRSRQGLIEAGALADDGGATAKRLAGETEFAAQRQARDQRQAAAFDQRLAAAAVQAPRRAAAPAEAAQAAPAAPAQDRRPVAGAAPAPAMTPELATRRRVAYRGFQADMTEPAAVTEHPDGTIHAVPALPAEAIPATAVYADIGSDVAPLLAAGATVQPAPDRPGIVSWTEPPLTTTNAAALDTGAAVPDAQQTISDTARLQRLEDATTQVRQQSYAKAAAQITAGDRAAADRTVKQAQQRLASLQARSQRVQAQTTQMHAAPPQPPKASE